MKTKMKSVLGWMTGLFRTDSQERLDAYHSDRNRAAQQPPDRARGIQGRAYF